MEPIAIPDHIVLPASGAARALPALELDPAPIRELTVRTGAYGATTTREILERFECRSLVVLHHGRLAYEWYATERDATAPHASFSVTKSFTGTLAALAVRDGTLDRTARVRDLIPELADTGFAIATVGNVADMAVAIAYSEDYEDADASETATFGFGDYLAALTGETPGEIRGLLARMQTGTTEHGDAFAYATPVTDVLAWLLERASGTAYVDLLRDRIWSHVGAEHHAILTTTPDGTPIAGGGLSLTTRDLARAGLAFTDANVVPSEVLESIRANGDPEVFRRGGHYDYLRGYSYRDQWWLPGTPTRPLSAWGIFGQLLWIEPDAELVIACHAGGPDASNERRDLEQDALCRALLEHLA